MQLERTPSAVVITLAGRGETTDSKKLHDLIDKAVELKPDLVVIDLTDVEFFGSYGVNALVRLNKGLEPHDGKIRLAGPSPAIRDLLSRSHLAGKFPIYSSVAAATASD
jgi:anti-anti-sigma factor